MNLDLVAQVQKHLTNEPSSAKEICARIDCWAPQTVRGALEYLRRAQRIVGTTEPIPTGFIRKYRRTG